ncbi:MAG TPA: glycosyltransferase [Dehalococcoidia bacterium]|nr:glycosyltransferase [Dehalococcoidia bacterium]
MPPKVSALVINWNGRRLIGPCLSALLASDYPELEVIVLDCASKDDSCRFVQARFPEVRLVSFPRDPLPDYAYNFGAGIAQGEFLLLMNNDCLVEPDTVSRLAAGLARDERRVVVPLEVDWQGGGVNWRGAYHLALPVYLLLRVLGRAPAARGGPFIASIACAMLTRDAIREVPANPHIGFYEEMEWFWRFRLRGISVRLCREARCRHKGAATAGPTTKSAYYAGRNVLAAHYICLGDLSLVLFAPVLAGYAVLKMLGYLFSGRFRHLAAFVRGLADLVRRRELLEADRRAVQGARLLSDAAILSEMLNSCAEAHARSGLPTGAWVRKLLRDG